jgi:RimJ/RimL family protein N-acetyltransferase
MAQRDAEMAEVFIVLDRAYEERLADGVAALTAAGVHVEHANDDTGVVEGTCATAVIAALRAMDAVKYVRVGHTWWADYPKGDPRDVIEPLIRRAEPRDAERVLHHVNAMASEASECIPLLPGELKVTIDEERKLLADSASADNTRYLIAEVDDELVGLCSAIGGKRQALRHSATLGLSVRKAFQGKGIGTLLMKTTIDWARASGTLRRLDLRVYHDNTRAIALYKKLGFEVEGRRRQSILRDGQLIDDIEMSLVW